MASTLNLFRDGAGLLSNTFGVSFIAWLDEETADETAGRTEWDCGTHFKRSSVHRSAVRSIAWLDEQRRNGIRVMKCFPILLLAQSAASPQAWLQQSAEAREAISTSAVQTNRKVDDNP